MAVIETENGVATLKGFEGVFANVVSAILALAGIAFFAMLLMGGFKYLTAGGEAPKIESAKKTLTYAVLGMTFIALSFLILQIIGSFTGVEDLGVFKIYQSQ